MEPVMIIFTSGTPDGAATFLTQVPAHDLGSLTKAQIGIPAPSVKAKETNSATFSVSSPPDFKVAIKKLAETQADLDITILEIS
jgi:hypothetical protein